MRAATIVCALALAGCATQPSLEELRGRVGNASDYQVCRAAMLAPGNYRTVANEEMARRRPDCTPYMASIQMEAQQRQQQAAQAQSEMASGLMLLQAAQPRPMPMPAISPTVTCVSRPSLGSTYTTCN